MCEMACGSPVKLQDSTHFHSNPALTLRVGQNFKYTTFPVNGIHPNSTFTFRYHVPQIVHELTLCNMLEMRRDLGITYPRGAREAQRCDTDRFLMATKLQPRIQDQGLNLSTPFYPLVWAGAETVTVLVFFPLLIPGNHFGPCQLCAASMAGNGISGTVFPGGPKETRRFFTSPFDSL